MKIGVIGMGVVGGNTAKVFGIAHKIIPYDKYKKEFSDKNKLKEADLFFICVPTPMKEEGGISYSAIYDSIETLREVTKNKLVVIRSTAVPGTTKSLSEKYPEFKFAFNPEFLTERNALGDMLRTDRVVIGTDKLEDYEEIKQVYLPLFPKAKYFHTNPETAEMIKYSANVMLAGQIALANELYQISSVLGVDWKTIKDIILLDDRIGRNINVPGPDGDFGFGGKCFPKDLDALIHLAKEKKYNPLLLEEVWNLNKRLRKEKGWLEKIKEQKEQKRGENE